MRGSRKRTIFVPADGYGLAQPKATEILDV